MNCDRMSELDLKSPQWHARARAIAERVHANLLPLGLDADRDYWFYDMKLPHHYTIIEMCDPKRITPDVLVACNRAVVGEKGDWGVSISIRDPKSDGLIPIVATSGGAFTLICTEDWVSKLIDEAYERMGVSLPPRAHKS